MKFRICSLPISVSYAPLAVMVSFKDIAVSMMTKHHLFRSTLMPLPSRMVFGSVSPVAAQEQPNHLPKKWVSRHLKKKIMGR